MVYSTLVGYQTISGFTKFQLFRHVPLFPTVRAQPHPSCKPSDLWWLSLDISRHLPGEWSDQRNGRSFFPALYVKSLQLRLPDSFDEILYPIYQTEKVDNIKQVYASLLRYKYMHTL
jgi:hypothetical protein